MSREIKFRGKRVDNGEWVTGFLVRFSEESASIVKQYGTMDISIYDVDPKTVGQFTGLRDKNGKEIYTGDIIQQFDDRCVVKDCSGGWELGMIHGGNTGSTFVISFLGEYCEVIDNIYENPEFINNDTSI